MKRRSTLRRVLCAALTLVMLAEPACTSTSDPAGRQVQVWRGSFYNESIHRSDDVQWELQITGNRIYGVHKSLRGSLYGDGVSLVGSVSGKSWRVESVEKSPSVFQGVVSGSKVSGSYRVGKSGQRGRFELTHQGNRTLNMFEAGLWRMNGGLSRTNSVLGSFGGSR